jgi:WD40 repeat protein
MSRMLCRFALAVGLLPLLGGDARPAAGPAVARPRVDALGDPLPDDVLARFGTSRFRDPSAYGVALSPDGKLLVLPGHEGLRLLDTTTGKEVRRVGVRGAFFGRNGAAFSPDGKFLALSDHKSVVVSDVARGVVVGRFAPGGRLHRSTTSFSGDGKLLAVGGQGFNTKLAVTIWDVAANKELKKIESDYDHQVQAALSADGKTVAVWGQSLRDRQHPPVLRLLDVTTGKARVEVKGEGYQFAHVVFSPDGKHLLTTEPGFPLCVRDAATGKVLRRFAACANPAVVQYSPDGAVLAVGSAGGVVQLFDARTGRRTGQCKAPPMTTVESVGFLPGNRALAAGTAFQTLRLWDVPSGHERTPGAGHLASVSAVAFSRDGKRLLSAGGDGVRVVALAGGKEVGLIEPPPDPLGLRLGKGNGTAATLSPDGRHAAWPDQFGRGLTVTDLSSREEIATLGTSVGPFGGGVVFAADGSALATMGTDLAGGKRDQTAEVWDLGSGLLRRKVTVPAAAHAWSVALSPGGKRLVVAPAQQFGGQAGGRVVVWDVSTGKEITALPIVAADRLAFSPDGSLLAAGGGGAVGVYDVASGRRLLTLEGGPNRVMSPLAFSPDGRLLAAVGGAGPPRADEVRLWELASGKVRAVLTGHKEGGTLALAFSPDGRLLASGGADTVVLLHDATGAAAAARLPGGRPTPARLAAWWADLGEGDAAKAGRAMARLLAWPAEAAALLGKELRPAAGQAPDAKDVRRWVGELGADAFETRQKATRALAGAGRAVRAELLAARATAEDPEQRRRLDELLRGIERGPLADKVRPVRAVEVLERLGTPAARRVLRKVAGGNPAARLTAEAQEALKRLGRKS